MTTTRTDDDPIIMYAHNACPQVPMVIGMLKQAQADYQYINIHEDSAARQYVREVNDGYESVPTLRFPDGSTLTEPSAGELRDKLQAMGYDVPWTALITGNFVMILTVIIIVYALLSFLEVW